MTMTAGFRAHAVPTARLAPGRPSRRAISPYVIVSPGGIVRKNSRTSRSNGATSRASGMSCRSPFPVWTCSRIRARYGCSDPAVSDGALRASLTAATRSPRTSSWTYSPSSRLNFEETPRLLLGEFGQEQRGRVGDPISARQDGAPFRNEAGTGELIEKGLRVGPVLQDQGHPRFAVLPANRRDEVRTLIRERRDDFFLATRPVEQQGDLVPGPRRMEDFAAGTVDLGGLVEAIHVSKAAEEQESAHRIRINGEARTSFRDFLQRPFGASRETHFSPHPT